jgi:uncharacterized protein (DUF433 family)
MTTAPSKPHVRQNGRDDAGAAANPTPSSESAQRRPPLVLSTAGEYFKQIADELMCGAVQVDQFRQHGAPVLDETRIPISYVLNELAAGKSWAEITATYPEVTEERIRAALRFAVAVFRLPQAIDVE